VKRKITTQQTLNSHGTPNEDYDDRKLEIQMKNLELETINFRTVRVVKSRPSANFLIKIYQLLSGVIT